MTYSQISDSLRGASMLETHSHTQFSIGTFPRVYRPSTGWRAFLVGTSLLIGMPAAVGIWYFGTGHEVHGGSDRALLVFVCAAFVIVSACLASWMFMARLTLWPDRIESRDLMTIRSLARDDISGRRLVQPSKGPNYLVLVPRSPRVKPLKIPAMYTFDAIFRQWTYSLPDLDEQDLRAAEEEIANNEEIGATPADRMQALNRGKWLSSTLSFTTILIGLWAAFFPRPYGLAICALVLLPWVAVFITARSGGLFKIDAKRNDPHPNVAIPFIAPGFILMLRVITDLNLLQWKGPLYVSITVGCVLGTAALISDRTLKKNRGTAIVMFMLAIAYGFGASMEANALLDHSPASVYEVRVTGKHVSSGRHRTYDLYLAPWGPKEEPDRISVSRHFYSSIAPGDSVCVALHEGAMRLPWYTVHPCR